jgi:hypothetical protein
MIRVACAVVALLLSTAALLPAQPPAREREFGRPEADWCRDDGDADFCEVREETLTNLNALDIDAGANGGVFVRGWDRNDVHVRVRITARARSQEEARALASETQLMTAGGNIRVDGPRVSGGRGWRDREWWAASFEVQVPRSAHVAARGTNGGITVEGVRGGVEAETTNGGVRFYDVAGDIRGRATNGGIDVELSGDRWEGPGLDVQTTNGGIRLWLPSNFSAELDARATNGGISVDLPVTVKGLVSSRRELRGTIGSGGPTIRARTTNGGVHISRR